MKDLSTMKEPRWHSFVCWFYASGRWDREELDDVIRALDRVVDDNRLPPRSRDILRTIWTALRTFATAAESDQFTSRSG